VSSISSSYWTSFRKSLALLIDEHEVKKKDLASRLDVTPQTISAWLGESAEPSAQKLFEMADFFGVSLDRLVGRTPPGAEMLPRLRELNEALTAALGLIPEVAQSSKTKARRN
jgi:transcriptional regulator with XRE-family HTH domain